MLSLSVLLVFAAVGCSDEPAEIEGTTPFEPNRPGFADEPGDVERYQGADPVVQEAQERFPTGLDVHRKVIARTCTPFDGVCHNQKEYPDLQTPGSLLESVNAPCNVQPKEYSAVFDRCEPTGDTLTLSYWEEPAGGEIAWVEYVVEGAEASSEEEPLTPGFHIHLRDALETERDEVWAGGQFSRSFQNEEGQLETLVFFTLETRWTIQDGGKHLVGEVPEWLADRVNELIAVGIRQGDLNRNETFGGGTAAVRMLEPGNPEESYLIARLRGVMMDERVPGSIMPLANQPLSISEMLALYCFVHGLAADNGCDSAGDHLGDQWTSCQIARPIDYNACPYADDPAALNLLGEGVTWSGRISQVLRTRCGGCHNDVNPAADLDLVSGDVYTRLLTGESTQVPGMPFVVPGEPDQSYLWWKITGADGMVGDLMPIGIGTNNALSDAELSDINTWIVNGATDQQ